MGKPEPNYPRAIAERFTTTHWGLVVAAGARATPESREALSVLCGKYWYPLYAYIRRHGYPRHEAEDLTQAFFAMVLEKGTFGQADPSLGKFRSYLLGALKNFLSDDRDRARARKRGGGVRPVPIDAGIADQMFSREQLSGYSPERAFDRQWGLTVLGLAMAELQARYAADGKQELFDRLQPLLSGPDPVTTYRNVAELQSTSEGAVKVAVHRMRRQYGDLVRQQILRTVDVPAEVDDEIRHLFEALSG